MHVLEHLWHMFARGPDLYYLRQIIVCHQMVLSLCCTKSKSRHDFKYAAESFQHVHADTSRDAWV